MSNWIVTLSEIAQVGGMAFVAVTGNSPAWIRWFFGIFAILWLVVKTLTANNS